MIHHSLLCQRKTNMMLWSQIRNRAIKTLTKRCFASPNYASQVTKTSTLLHRNVLFNQSGFVRCYAAPVLPNQPNSEPKEEKVTRLNDDITADFIRLVFDDGHEVMSLHVALKRAKELKLDLVEVDRNAKPPVCKIMDYHRELYKHKQQQKERKKSKADTSLRKGPPKEVRFAAKTDHKDLETKAMQVKKLMEKGYRVKCMATGKEEDANLGGLLSRLVALIEDVAIIESGPFVEKTQAYALVRHMKYGLPKKSGKKKPAKPTPIESLIVQELEPVDTQEDSSESEQDYVESEDEDFNPSKVETPRIPPPPPPAPPRQENRRHGGGGRNQNIPPPQVSEDRYGGGRDQTHRNSGGPMQAGDNRYGGVRDQVKTNQRPPAPVYSPPRVQRDSGLSPQVSEDRNGGGRDQTHRISGGPTQAGASKYGGGQDQVRTNQRPPAPVYSPARVQRDSGLPLQVSEDRYGGGRVRNSGGPTQAGGRDQARTNQRPPTPVYSPPQVDRDTGATSQVGENRYGGGRAQVQPTKPLESAGEDTSETSSNTRPPQRSSYGIFSAPRPGGSRK